MFHQIGSRDEIIANVYLQVKAGKELDARAGDFNWSVRNLDAEETGKVLRGARGQPSKIKFTDSFEWRRKASWRGL